MNESHYADFISLLSALQDCRDIINVLDSLLIIVATAWHSNLFCFAPKLQNWTLNVPHSLQPCLSLLSIWPLTFHPPFSPWGVTMETDNPPASAIQRTATITVKKQTNKLKWCPTLIAVGFHWGLTVTVWLWCGNPLVIRWCCYASVLSPFLGLYSMYPSSTPDSNSLCFAAASVR